ncbi:hypothetical protein CR513_10018, partial [Mucuna pruriens]
MSHNLDLKGLNINKSKIVEPVYSENSESPNYSPTRSQIKFGLDKILKQNIIRRLENEQTEEYRKIFYEYLEEKEINIYFFDWFSQYCEENKINYPFKNQVSTIGVIDNNWKTKDNEIIRSEYPPQQTITIEFARMEIEASPFKDTIREHIIMKKELIKIKISNILLNKNTRKNKNINLQKEKLNVINVEK